MRSVDQGVQGRHRDHQSQEQEAHVPALGELDESDLERVSSHLEACRDCGLEAETYRAIKAAVARLEKPDAATLERLRQFAEAVDEAH